MKYLNKFKIIYILFFYLFAIISSEIGPELIMENSVFINISIIIITIVFKFLSIPYYADNYRIKEYLLDILESLIIFMGISLLANKYLISLTNTIIFETALFIIIGYSDYFISRFYYKKVFRMDRINMYSILAIIYIFGEVGTTTLGDFSNIRDSIAFIVFIDLFFSIIINRFMVNYNSKKKANMVLNDSDYFSLSPKTDIRNSPYFEMIDYGVRNQDIKNIAITSIFGGGKTSVIESYLKSYEHPKEIKISLANFEKLEIKNTDNNDFKKEKIESALQLKIIKHLFYKVNPYKLPKSKYVKKFISPRLVVGTIIFFYCTYLAFRIITNYYFTDLIVDDSNVFLHILPILFTIMFLIIRSSGIALKNIDTKIAKFEIQSKEEIGTFDKYIDELVYFFSSTEYRILIIEDVDRYNSLNIFNSLRELNILLNDCETVSGKVTFIYALNDHMIEEENKKDNKSKFFDLIVPIIPISSSYNSGGIFLNLLKNKTIRINDENTKEVVLVDITPSEDFLLGLSFYISDMRTIKNICNEYFSTLNAFESEQGLNLVNLKNKTYLDKLFAIIVYKNYMPKDYSMLFSNKGVLFTLLDNKCKFYETKKDDIANKILQLEEELDYLDNFSYGRDNIDNLIYNLFRVKYPNSTIFVHESQTSPNYIETFSVNIFVNLRNKLAGKFFSLNGRSPRYDFNKELETIFGKTGEGRYTITGKKRGEISSDIHRLRLEISTIMYKEISELIKNTSLESIKETYHDIINLEESKNGNTVDKYEIMAKVPEILIYLLKSGNISDDYSNYINYFVEGKISRNDRIFIQSLYSKERTDFDLVLTGLDSIYKLLKGNAIEQPNLLNCSLFDYLILNEDYELLESLFRYNEYTFLVDFFRIYLERSKDIGKMINYVIKEQTDFYNELLQIKQEDNSLFDLIVNYTLLYNVQSNIKEILTTENSILLNGFDRVILYHSELIDDIDIQRYNHNLILLDVKFSSLVDSTDNNDFIDFIEINNLFEINYFMLKKIINKGKTEIEPSYTNILENSQELIEYIDANLSIFVEEIYSKNITYSENESIMLKLLNHETVESEIKTLLIDYKNILFEISDLSLLKSNIYYTKLMLANKVSYNKSNISLLVPIIVSTNEKLNICSFVSFILINLRDDEEFIMEINNSNKLLVLAVKHCLDDLELLKNMFKRFIYDKSIISTFDEDDLVILSRNSVIQDKLLLEVISEEILIPIFYKAAITDNKFNINLFLKNTESIKFNQFFEDFIINLKNKEHKMIILEYKYENISQKKLFNMLPESLRDELIHKQRPTISSKDECFHLIKIGKELGWLSLSEKENDSFQINPRISNINKNCM